MHALYRPNQLNILLINQFYPPDIAPTGVKLHDLASHLVADGHIVTVLASKGSYNGNEYFQSDILDGVRVIRLQAFNFGRKMHLGKLADYLSFFIVSFAKLLVLKPRNDVVVALTTPPYLGILPVVASSMGYKGILNRHYSANCFIRKRTKVIHWIMDLYPDVINAHGLLKTTNIIYRFLGFINRITFAHTDTILALGPSMVNRIEKYIEQPEEKVSVKTGDTNINDKKFKRTRKNPEVKWVPLWGDSDLRRLTEREALFLRSKYGWKENDIVLMHAGNLGLGVGLYEFLTVADKLGQEGPVWAFFGGGKKWNELKRFAQAHRDTRIELYDYAPKTILGAADVHLVSLLSSWTGVGVPSKLQNIFSIGKPAIFIGSMESEMAQWIRESGGGWAINEGDVNGLLLAIEEAKDTQECIRRGRAAVTFAEQFFNQNKNCELIANIITS